VALGLDAGDNIVRRRLAQKMQFIMDENDEVGPPSQRELEKYFEENRERYKNEPRYSFYQITIAERSQKGMEKVRELKEIIHGKMDTTDVSQFGDYTLMPFAVDDYGASEIDRKFGSGFSERLKSATPSQWYGPLESGMGLHFVYVHKKQDASYPDFSSLKSTIEQDWSAEQRLKVSHKKLEELISKYKVRTELDQWLNATTSLK
jgi:parvulin-like peptidyl-prolyl isomerase